MIRAPLSATSVLDESAEVVTLTAAPWAGLLIAALLPYRFLQAVFLDQLFEVGGDAAQYGNLLGRTATLTVAAMVIALCGRALYARACRLALARGAAPGRETWRIPPAALASYILTGSAAIAIGYATFVTIIGLVVAAIFAGMAVGTMELNERASLVTPFRLIAHSMKDLKIPFALLFVFFCATVIALVNLIAVFQLGVWLAGPIAGSSAPQWQIVFAPGNRRFVLALIAGAFVLVEPFWIAAHVVYIRKAGANESGDDLRAWFYELRRAS